MITVPPQFRPTINTTYPQENFDIFESWLSKQPMPKTDREYLGVNWTSYFVNNAYGQDKRAIYDLQQFIYELPKDKKYWTVVQYDDGILNDVSSLDLLVFEMSKPCEFPIPLICMPHSYKHKGGKKYFANFVGARTHPIRDSILSINRPEYYISDRSHDINSYCNVMANSIFTIAPRGYGMSSFRAFECLQYGSIPVYISDTHIEPYNIPFNEYGVKVDSKDVHILTDILASIPTIDILRKQDRIAELYESHFTYQGVFDRIKEYLCSSV